MAYGNNQSHEYSYGSVSERAQQQFRDTLDLAMVEVPDEPTLSHLQATVPDGSTSKLAEMGQAIKNDLTESLDAASLETELMALEEKFKQVPELRTAGIPDDGETPYQDLTGPAWRIEEHLANTGFFASAEENLPSFSSEHIESTTRQLLQIESLNDKLSILGLSDDEQVALVTNVVTSSEQLSWWEPTINYPSARDEGFEEGVDHEYVPPLHERAMGGALLWIDGVDWHLWQKQVLITQSMIDRGVWDVKTMLAGAYLLGDAARRVAEETISDENLTTLVTASTAMMIIGQEFLVEDIVRITDKNRRPRDGGEM